MNRMKRWTMSVTSWVDGVLAQVENHEAVADASIEQVRASTAEARVRLRRVDRDTARLRESLRKEEAAAATWKERASRLDDEDAALECLRRHKASERKVGALAERLTEQERVAKELRHGVQRLSGRLSELTERRNVMRARQSRAEATRGVAGVTGHVADIEDVFDRWESHVGTVELIVDDCDPLDAFESDLHEQEEREALVHELAELRRGED